MVSAASLALARQWLAYAEEDLAAARRLGFGFARPAAYHCQQAAEKAMKAVLCLHELPFRPTHDLRELGQAVFAVAPDLEAVLRPAARLSVFAVRARYPDGQQVCLTEPELLSAIAVAAEVVDGAARVLAERPGH